MSDELLRVLFRIPFTVYFLATKMVCGKKVLVVVKKIFKPCTPEHYVWQEI